MHYVTPNVNVWRIGRNGHGIKQLVLLKLEVRSIIGNEANNSNWQERLIEVPAHKILLIIIKAGGYASNGGGFKATIAKHVEKGLKPLHNVRGDFWA